MSKPRKIQFQGSSFKLWNLRGEISTSVWNPTSVMSSDAWFVTNGNKTIGGVTLREGDMVIALIDNPQSFSSEAAGSEWLIIRHLTDSELLWIINQGVGGGSIGGELLRAKIELTVNTAEIGGNYSLSTKRLVLSGIVLEDNDNINIYVNGVKYSNTGQLNAITGATGNNYVIWYPGNSGFELANGDLIEIEIFNT